MDSKNWKYVVLGTVVVAVAALLIALFGGGGEGPFTGYSYQTANYSEQGGAKWVVGSGGELEVQSGGTFDLQSGATVDFSGGVDLDSATLTWDADADTSSIASSDDIVTHTLGAATGKHSFVTGNLQVGDGVPDTTLNGEDAYVEGTFEVDGALNFDGAMNLAGAATLAGALSVTGNTDISGTLEYGSNNLSPLGWASASDAIVCGTTGTFTATTTVDLSGSFSDVDYAWVTQITDPADTASAVSVDDPGAGTNLVVNSWTLTPTVGVGTTGINAFYCAVGDE